jgi:hypothetical protein
MEIINGRARTDIVDVLDLSGVGSDSTAAVHVVEDGRSWNDH